MSPRQFILLLAVLAALFYIYELVALISSNEKTESADLARVLGEIVRLERLLIDTTNNITFLREEWAQQSELFAAALERARKRALIPVTGRGAWPQPIPILVFACNRAVAIKNHLTKLLKYRSVPQKFPIIVSQDCDSALVADVITSFGSDVNYIKHVSGEKANITVAKGHERYVTYYRIARHYKLALSHVFDKLGYTSVIITEDDLDIAADFFNYFSATRYLLDEDSSLYCVSAWNDNGKPNLIDKNAAKVLYRSDFFPGLGWMMTKKLWEEMGPIWPSGFWDDWIRDPLRRRNRTCIRPEISRTAMTSEGQSGASKGLFFTRHLAKIAINTRPVDFTKEDLNYLLKEKYDGPFLDHVYSVPELTLAALKEKVIVGSRSNESPSKGYRIQYRELQEYLNIADTLQIMRDFKAGVPRTAYLGVVTCFVNNIRVYVAPDRSVWRHYNPGWEAPELPADMGPQQ